MSQPSFAAAECRVDRLGQWTVWDLDTILAGSRLRVRRSYAAAPVASLADPDFVLAATLQAPLYSVVLPAYTEDAARRVLKGEARVNPHHVRREQ